MAPPSPEPEPGQSLNHNAKRAFACERCSRRKQRCDRTIPLCAPCRQARAACIDSAREEAVVLGKDREITRKGYVTLLLDQITAMEEKLNNEMQAQANDSRPSLVQQSPASASGAPTPLAPAPTSMDMSLLSLSAMAEPCSREGEFLKQLSTSRIIASVTEIYGGNPERASRVGSLWDGISSYLRHPAGATQRLHIPREDADKALSTYLEVVDIRFPRLPVAKVLLGIAAISDPDESKYRQTLAKDPAHIFMAYAVMAIVPLVSDSYPIPQGSWVSVHLLSKCLKVLDLVFRHEDGVDIIQCLQLLVILAIHCSTAGSAWHLLGFAMNKCIALGYHREDPKTAFSTPATELLQRRWAFWGCYSLDVLVCAALGRPLSIDKSYITTPIPDVENDARESTVPSGQNFGTASSAPYDDGMRLRDLYHVHLFRYAGHLASVISDTPSSVTRPGTSGSFEHFLGRALHWRNSGPPHDNPLNQEVYLFQTSLYNTLVLRIAIREILTSFDFDYSNSDGPAARFRTWILNGWRSEQRRVLQIKLPSICTAVARSLNRTRMYGRSYLSLLTGYSSLTMALACLYCIAVRVRLAAIGGDAGDGQQLDREIASQSANGAGPTPLARATPGSSLSESPEQAGMTFLNTGTWYRLGSADSKATVASTDEYAQLDTALSVAVSKLDVVGRQFPRLHEYRAIVLKLHSLLVVLSTQRPAGLGNTVQDCYDTVKSCPKDIGPIHLQQLTAALIHVSTWQQPLQT